jgi:diguanylate cyclase (GGDEF)-like protein
MPQWGICKSIQDIALRFLIARRPALLRAPDRGGGCGASETVEHGRERYRTSCRDVSAPPDSPKFQNPLRALPSVLGMPARQAEWHTRLHPDADSPDLDALLRLDPLAMLGALRVASAPAFAVRTAAAVDPPTAAGLLVQLGPTAIARLLSARGAGPVATEPLRAAWRQSLALAHAARRCAGQAVNFDPEAAYLLGLIANLPDWIGALRGDGSKPTNAEVLSCIRAWRLPQPVTNALFGRDPAWNALLRGAVYLITDPATAGEYEAAAAAALTAVGLPPDVAPATPTGPDAGVLRAKAAATDALGRAVSELLGPQPTDRYQGIIAALLRAARKHGGYDRALYAKLQPHDGSLTLQARCQGSPQALTIRRLGLGTADANQLQQALRTREPVVVHLAADGGDGLAAALGVDELLAVPIQPALAQPSFLLLDRGLGLGAIELAHDGPLATTLGQVGTLLHSNLLLRRRFARAQRFSLTDPLTHLFNRRMGVIALDQEVARAARTARPLSLLMCDLDYFKRLNDTFGHAAGDRALHAVAELLRKTVRKGDTVCRLGGEEFLVVLPDTQPEDAAVLAARLFTAIHVRGEELALPLTVSIGMTSYRPADTGERMLQRADHALYASKGQGRNRFSIDVEPSEDEVRSL